MPQLPRVGYLIMALLLAFAVVSSAHFSTSVAQSPPIILITSQDSSPYQEIIEGFRRHLDHQRIEGPLLIYSLPAEPQQIKEHLANATKEGVRLFVTVGSPAT